MTYEIVTHDQGWKVVRQSDGKVMCWNLKLTACLRWVRAWGDVDLGR